jgi:hypothetical protein
MCIREVSDIEETIWAPRYGLKGQLDGTLKVGGGGTRVVRPGYKRQLQIGCLRAVV